MPPAPRDRGRIGSLFDGATGSDSDEPSALARRPSDAHPDPHLLVACPVIGTTTLVTVSTFGQHNAATITGRGPIAEHMRNGLATPDPVGNGKSNARLRSDPSPSKARTMGGISSG